MQGAALAQQASAAAPDRNETVTTRARPDYDARGARVGGFLLNLGVGLEGRYDDNIFREENNTVDDYIAAVAPRAALSSTWSRHAVNVYADAELGRYDSNTAEDYDDWSIGSDGRFDIAQGTFLSGRLVTNQEHEDRGSPDDAGGLNPTTYQLIEGDAALEYRPARIGLRLDFEGDRYRFDNTPTSTGVTNNADRDRDEAELSATGSFQIQPQYDAFVRFSYNDRQYENTPDDSGFNRDSDGWAAVVGARLDFTGVLFGDLFAGYREQSYDDAAFSKIDGPQVGATLFWNPTGLTTLTFRASRSIQETTLADASGYWATAGSARVDHELRRNVLLNAQLGYTNNDYNGISREDDLVNFGIGGTYLINRRFRASATYTFDERDSSIAGSDYDNNLVVLRISAQL